MKKIIKFYLVLIISLMFTLINLDRVNAICSKGILNNGLGGIYISVNSAPYTTFESYSYGQYAYTTDGCAWFASARVNQITGKGNTIRSGANWWRNGTGVLGTNKGQEIKGPAIVCWEGHVAILEKIVGSTAYISEGGNKNSDDAHGYTIIRSMNVNALKGANPNFLGFVYLTNNSISPIVQPTISTNKTSYTVGETVNLSWRASPSNSNLSHYWLNVIAPSGTWIYGGTMNKNTSYNFKVNEVGDYKVTVYATPLGSKEGEGSLVANKTISVKNNTIQPGKPTLKVTPGTGSYKTTFSWSKTSNTHYYALRIYKKSSDDVYKLISNIKSTNYSLILPAGEYHAVLNSSNSTYKTYTFSQSVNFSVMKTPTKSSDGWYYVDKLPSYVNSSQYTIQYKNITQKISKTSPGKSWVNKGLSKTQYENSGSPYWSKIELPTSNTRVLIGYNYYHYCGANTGVYVNYELGGNYQHEDSITNLSSVYVDKSGPDDDNPNYKYYILRWNNGNLAYCNSNSTCNGIYGTHGNRSYIWYRNSQYQNKVKVNYYKFVKESGWGSSKDSSATSIKVRYKLKNTTSVKRNVSTLTYSKISNKTYTGKQIKPSIVVKYGTKTLKNGTDYTLSYGTNKSSGKGTVKITGKGNYTGTITKTFTIAKRGVSKLTYSKISNKSYTGKQIKPSITVKYSGKTLKKGTDYTVSYGKNKSTGKGTVKITGKGNYTGSITKTFYIVPKKVTISSAKSSAKKKITVKYKKVTGASGYQIAYQKSGSKKWTYTTVSSKSASKTLTKLTSKKNYKVKVRAYKTVSGKKYYGTYSATKTVKVK